MIIQYMRLASLLVKGVYVLSSRGAFVIDEHMNTILYSSMYLRSYADKGPI